MKLKSILKEATPSKGSIAGRFSKIRGLDGDHRHLVTAKRLVDLTDNLVSAYGDMSESIFKGEVNKNALVKYEHALKQIRKILNEQAETFESLSRWFDEKSIVDQMQKISDWIKGDDK